MKAMMKRVCFTLMLLVPLLIAAQSAGTKRTTIFWDCSLSMQNRIVEKEWTFLENYFSENPDVDINLVLFSNDVLEKASYNVRSGNWNSLKLYLNEVNYDGGTSYSGLATHAVGEDIIMFTDGHQNTYVESPYFSGNFTAVNSRENFDQANLNLLTILNSGSLVNLAANPKSDPVTEQTYFGRIQGAQLQERQVQISIKDRLGSYITPEADGTYSVRAFPGEILLVREPGGRQVEKVLRQNTNIDIWLGGTGEIMLEEVTVTGVREEPSEEKLTAYGIQKADAIGYAVQSIDEEDIPEASTDVSNAIQGKFSGVQLGQNDDISQTIIRTITSINSNNYPLIVLDGVPMPKSNSSGYNSTNPTQSSTFLDPRNIESITVLKSLAATNRYGSLGNNGAFLITTKTGTYGKAVEKRDLARVKGNVYDGKLKVSAKTLVTPYLKALRNAKSIKEAYDIYLDQREEYAEDPAFYIDIYDYFKAASPSLALRVLTNILEDNRSGYSTLRAMLFKCQQDELRILELEVANKLMERFPEKLQSHFDMGMALKNNANYQKSMDVFTDLANGKTVPVENGLKKSIDTEIKNLVFRQGNDLDKAKIPAIYRNNLRYNARVSFEWSHPASEFELQFVNPQNLFFTWEHTAMMNEDRLEEEWDQGYSREEFEIVGEEFLGSWLINVKYLGNANPNDNTPTFLKCLVQYNFGKPDQREEYFLVRLHEINSEEQLVKLSVK